ncbi:MAG: hypothetical protein QW496_05765, partial [Desulfurococcaceae archaeon]
LYLHIKNEGSAAAVIYKIEVSGLGTASITNTNGLDTLSGGEVKVNPGAEGWITCSLGTATAVAGTRYQVTIYTRAGNVISATVQAK